LGASESAICVGLATAIPGDHRVTLDTDKGRARGTS
jgi:hypothetical protein